MTYKGGLVFAVYFAVAVYRIAGSCFDSLLCGRHDSPTAPVSLHLVNHKNTTTPVSNQMVHTSTGFALFFCMFTVILAMGNILDEKREGTVPGVES